MKNKIEIYDTTLRDGEQAPYMDMNPEAKLALAFKLKELGIDIIEAGFPISNEEDKKAIELISKEVRGITISALARAKKEDIEIAADSLKYAQDPMIHIFLPASKKHVEEKLKKTFDEICTLAYESIIYAKKFVPRVILGVEDATRADPIFIKRLINVAQNAGAETLILADTTGHSQPDELAKLIRALKPEQLKIKLGIHCHNDLGQATANTLEGIKHGVNHIQTTLLGIGERAGNASFEQVVLALETRKDYYNKEHTINLDKLWETCNFCADLVGLCVSIHSPVIGDNVFSHEAGIHQQGILMDKETYEIIDPFLIGKKTVLVKGKHSGKHIEKDIRFNETKEDLKERLRNINSNKERIKHYEKRVKLKCLK